MLRLLLPILFAAGPTSGGTSIVIHLQWPAGVTNRSAVVAFRTLDGKSERETAASGDEVTVSLPDGQWFVTPKAAAHWGDTALLAVPAQREITVTMVPATRLRAEVKLTRPAKAAEVTVHLQSIDDADPLHATTRAVVCPVNDGRIDCIVPA